MTKIIKVNPKKPELAKVKEAAKVIKAGGIVAFPTETIYGLGADAFNEKAVEKIFVAKGRPQDNPLIVHISDKKQIKDLVKEIPKSAEKLIKKFMPGPLTIVLKKSDKISGKVTAGLETVAIRMPSNKIAISLIKQSGPIAAPSANLSGTPSTTSAEYVIADLNKKVDIIIDGGNTEIGLESTVISLVNEPTILRPGKITKEQLEKVLGKVSLVEKSKTPASPGMKYHHYAPEAKVVIAQKLEIQKKVSEFKKLGKTVAVIAFSYFEADDSFLVKNNEDLAKNLFNFFREFDKADIDVIIVQSVEEKGLGLAIMNRLKRAASIE